MSSNERPLLESYWVEPGRLLAGEYPGSASDFQTRKRLTALLSAGLDSFLDLTRPGELPPYHDILAEEAHMMGIETIYRRFAIGDYGLPTRQQMTQILDAIDSALAEGRKIYLHCWGGIGRTGTTVGCYLVRHGKSGNEALRQLASWWRSVPKSARYPHSPETPAQMNFILTWDELA
jgi:predicted protein tyrosine phosphatase